MTKLRGHLKAISHSPSDFSRRAFIRDGLALGIGCLASGLVLSGCTIKSETDSAESEYQGVSLGKQVLGKKSERSSFEPEIVWGRLGLADGRFQKPRAMTIDRTDQLYIVDKTGRVQVFDRDGNFLRKWNTPAIANGKPTGLGISLDQSVMVADTHYFQVLVYTLQGEPLPQRTIGGSNGPGIGQFAFVTDVVQDQSGNYYISEYGEFDRIQKYSSTGEFICRFGETGDGPLQFSRPQSMVIDFQGNLWISDACNHRIQVIRCEKERPELVQVFGQQGDRRGDFRYPYGIHLGRDESIYVAEFGNHRIQKLDLTGKSLGIWGEPGRKPGQLDQPWTLVEDSLGRIHVLDTGNNRVQRVLL